MQPNPHEIIWSQEVQLTHLRIENWLNQDIHHWQWYILVAVLIIPWILWWRQVNRPRLLEILLLGMFLLIVSSYLDALITELGLWSYHYYVIPLWPRLIPVDFTVIPITFMWIYQKYPRWGNYALATSIVAILYSFVGEPFLAWIDIYQLHGWRYIYSLPIYIVLGLGARWLIETLLCKQAYSIKR